MSHKASSWLAEIPASLINPSAFRVLFHLCDAHNSKRDPDTACFPSQRRLMDATGLSNGGLNNALNALEQSGLVSRRRTRNADGTVGPTYYILGCDVDLAQPCPKNGDGSESAHQLHEGGDGPSPNSGLHHLHAGGDEPIIEPVNTTQRGCEASQAEVLCLEASGPGLSETSRRQIVSTCSVIGSWLGRGFDLELDILPVIRSRTAEPRENAIRTWDYFTAAVEAANRRRLARPAEPAEKSTAPAAGERMDLETSLRLIADWINSDRYLPQSAVNNRQRDALLDRGLVTPERLRERGIY